MEQQSTTKVPKIHPSQARIEHDGHHWRHIVITLKETQPAALLREAPEAFSALQGDRTFALRRGDRVSLISADGLAIFDALPVVNAEGANVWLGAPLRVIQLQELSTGLYSNGRLAVVPNGSGYSVKRLHDNTVEEKVFGTADAARQDVLRRDPVRVA